MRTMRFAILLCVCLFFVSVDANAQSGKWKWEWKEYYRLVDEQEKGDDRMVVIDGDNKSTLFENLAFVVSVESVHPISGSDYLKQNGFKYSLGAVYMLPIGKVSAVGLGVRYGMCSLNLRSRELYYSCSIYDDEGESFEYRAYGRDLKEKQTIHLIEIPIYYRYRLKNMYFDVGPEIAIPLGGKSKTVSGNVELTGYYPKYNVELTDLLNHGFGKYDISGEKSDLDTKVNFGINACFGYCFQFKEADINCGLGIKYMFGGYVNSSKNYLEFPATVNSLSCVGKKAGVLSWGVSLGIGL